MGATRARAADGAAALLLGDDTDGPVIAEVIPGAGATREFLDRWRTPGNSYSKVWEERFGEAAYLPLVEDAVRRSYETAGLTPEDIDAVVLTGLHARAVRGAGKFIGVAPDKYVDNLANTVGNTGTAHPAIMLAHALDTAEPNQTIMLVHLADGCDRGLRAHHRRDRRLRTGPDRPVADRRRQRRPRLREVPDLA